MGHPIIWVITAVVALFSFGGIFYYFKNKKFLLIGMKGAGKTTYCNAMLAIAQKKKSWRAEQQKQSSTMEEVPFRIDTFLLMVDTAGAENYKKRWAEMIKDRNPDCIFYFYDISELEKPIEFNNGFKCYYYKNLAADFKMLRSLCQEHQKKLVIIGTHSDIKYDENKADKYLSEALSCLDEGKYRQVRGSIVDYKSAETLIKNINKTLKQLKI